MIVFTQLVVSCIILNVRDNDFHPRTSAFPPRARTHSTAYRRPHGVIEKEGEEWFNKFVQSLLCKSADSQRAAHSAQTQTNACLPNDKCVYMNDMRWRWELSRFHAIAEKIQPQEKCTTPLGALSRVLVWKRRAEYVCVWCDVWLCVWCF